MIELTEIFTRRIVSLIMHGISSSFFGMGRDLIFSFLREALFLLCMERLGYMIKEVVDSGVWSGVALGHLICSLRMMYSSSQNSSSLPPGGDASTDSCACYEHASHEIPAFCFSYLVYQIFLIDTNGF